MSKRVMLANGSLAILDSVWQDVRYACRRALREPAIAATAVLTIAVSIGFNTALFTAITSVLLRPLPYQDPDRLVAVHEMAPNRPPAPPRKQVITPEQFFAWRDTSRSFQEMAATELAVHNPRVRFVLGGEPDTIRLWGAAVTPNLFRLLGVRAEVGRTLTDADGTPGHDKVAVLGHALWQERFGGDRSVVGRTVRLSDDTYTIVGVMPKSFKFTYPDRTDVWIPVVLDTAPRGAVLYTVVARLKPGVPVARARADMDRVFRPYRERSQWTKDYSVLVVPLHEDVVGRTRPAFLLLVAAVGFVLLISCANIANLLLARLATRQRDTAVRLALGASRRRLARQLLTESLVLALAGGALGLLLAKWTMPAVAGILPVDFPRTDELGVDRWVLAFTAGLSTLSGLLFGLAPACQCMRSGVGDGLKASGRPGQTRRAGWLGGAFVAGEVALVLVLLTGAGLMINSLWRLLSVDLGFAARNVVAARIMFPRASYRAPGRSTEFEERLLARVRTMPGVTQVSATSSVPIGGVDYTGQFGVEGGHPGSSAQVAAWRTVADGYFELMRIPILRGRGFNDRDTVASPKVAVVSESFARQFFPGSEAIGRRLIAGLNDEPREIVGISGDVHRSEIREPIRPTIYMVRAQDPGWILWLVARATSPRTLFGPIRQAVRQIDPSIPVDLVKTMDQIVNESVASERFYAVSLGGLALVALLLASVGIYGVVSYTVGQRIPEIGIRMALGATRGAVLAAVLGQVARLVAAGLAIGAAGTWALRRFVSSFLFGVAPGDPWTLATVTALLCVVALLAACIPAARATRVNPVDALRAE